MGFWDGLQKIAGKANNRSSSDTSSDSNRVPYLTSLPEIVWKVGDTGAQKLIEYVPNADHRHKIGRVLTGLGKFAVDSAVNESLKCVTGGVQVYKIVKEGLKDQSPLHPTNRKQKAGHALVVEDLQAKIDRLQEELNFIKQQNEASIQCAMNWFPLYHQLNPARSLLLRGLMLNNRFSFDQCYEARTIKYL